MRKITRTIEAEEMARGAVDASQQPTRIHWRVIALFYVLACAWSWPFFWLRDFHSQWFYSLPGPGFLKTSLIMWGPGIAALTCWRVFTDQWPRRISILGSRPWRSLAFYFVPMAGLAMAGVSMQPGAPPSHALVIALAIVGLFNTLGEELGWRSFLQDALHALQPWQRWMLIGSMWCGWHFTNLFVGRDAGHLVVYLAWYPLSCVALSVLLGSAVERGRAVLISVTLHAWLNLLFEFPAVNTYRVFACAVVFWVWMMWRWPKPAGSAGAHAAIESA